MKDRPIILTIFGYLNLIFGGSTVGQVFAGNFEQYMLLIALGNIAMGLFLLVDWKTNDRKD